MARGGFGIRKGEGDGRRRITGKFFSILVPKLDKKEKIHFRSKVGFQPPHPPPPQALRPPLVERGRAIQLQGWRLEGGKRVEEKAWMSKKVAGEVQNLSKFKERNLESHFLNFLYEEMGGGGVKNLFRLTCMVVFSTL